MGAAGESTDGAAEAEAEAHALLTRTLGGAGRAASREEARRAAERFLAAARPRAWRRALPYAAAALLLLAGPVATRIMHAPVDAHGPADSMASRSSSAGTVTGAGAGAGAGEGAGAAAGHIVTTDPAGGSDVRMGEKAALGGAVAAVVVGVATGTAWMGPRAPGAGKGGEAVLTAHGMVAPDVALALRRGAAAELRIGELEAEVAKLKAEKRLLEGRIAGGEGAGPVRVRRGGPGAGAPGDAVIAFSAEGAGPGGPGMQVLQGSPGAASASALPSDATPDQKIEALIKATDWDAAAAALAKIAEGRGNRQGMFMHDPALRLELSRLELAIAEMSRALGASDPDAAYDDPRVREAFAAARLKAFGASLDARQREALRTDITRRASQRAAEAPPRTIAEKALRSVREDLALEESLPSILTAEQLADWLARAGDDPFLGKPWPRMVMGVDEGADVGTDLAQGWARRFQIGVGGAPALTDIARRFADGMAAAPPPSKTLPAAERRLAVLRRTVRTLEVQVQCERELASEGTFSAEERARTADGLGGIFEILRGGMGPGGHGGPEDE